MANRYRKHPGLEEDEAQLKNVRQIFTTLAAWCLLIVGFFDGLVIFIHEFLQSASVGFATFIGLILYIFIKDNLQDLAWALRILWRRYMVT
ncbi:hypothetical protein [Microbulbifer agarilyticus]